MGELNNKQQTLEKIIEIVVSCCRTEVSDGVYSLTYEDVLGKSKKENMRYERITKEACRISTPLFICMASA